MMMIGRRVYRPNATQADAPHRHIAHASTHYSLHGSCLPAAPIHRVGRRYASDAAPLFAPLSSAVSPQSKFPQFVCMYYRICYFLPDVLAHSRKKRPGPQEVRSPTPDRPLYRHEGHVVTAEARTVQLYIAGETYAFSQARMAW